MHQANGGPLSAERVLDLGSSKASAFCSKMLGDLGAEVVKVIPAGSTKSESPYLPVGSADSLGEHLFFNTSKLSVEVGKDGRTSREDLDQLVATYDVVIVDAEDSLPGIEISHLILKQAFGFPIAGMGG